MTQQVSDLLIQLEHELTALSLWQSSPVSEQALRSVQPFSCDTLRFEQWLQFVFIVKIKQMIDAGMPLPRNANITPMAEHSFAEVGNNASALIAVIRELDKALS